MKLVLATAFPADAQKPRGGVEAVSVILADALGRASDLDIHVVTMDPACPAPHQDRSGRITVHRLPWRARRMLSGATGPEAQRLRHYVQALSPDVVHAHDTYGIMLSAIDRPRVLTIHGFIHADTAVSGERFARLRSVLWRRAEHRAWANFPHIISISPYVRERLTGIATGVIHDIDNPTAEPFFAVARANPEPRVFCAASITPRKNIVGLVEAFARLRARGVQATLRIAGPQSMPEYTERVRETIRRLGVERDVTLLPSLTTPEVCRELSSATVLALLSLEENSPLVVQEAMAAGVPVVTSNRCGMPYQVVDGETGFLVDPHNPAAAATCLDQLLQHRSVREEMGQRAAQIARERFHPAAVARRTRAVYDAALGRRFSRQPAAPQHA